MLFLLLVKRDDTTASIRDFFGSADLIGYFDFKLSDWVHINYLLEQEITN
jgi:hypothetical protein